MATRNIRELGDDVLRKECKPVKEVNRRTRILIEDMFDTMYEANGVGLAAPQVGILKQIFVVDVGDEEGNKVPYVFINPEILNNNVQIKRGFLTDDTAIHKYSYKISFFMNTCDTKRAVNILEDLTQRIKKANSFLGYEVKENEFEQNNNYIKIPVIFNGIAQHNINWLTDIKQKAKCLI